MDFRLVAAMAAALAAAPALGAADVIECDPLRCVDRTVVAERTCSADASVLGLDTGFRPEQCVQEPAGPYPDGTTEVRLTCRNSDRCARCAAKVTVEAAGAPLVAVGTELVLDGRASQTVSLSQCLGAELHDRCGGRLDPDQFGVIDRIEVMPRHHRVGSDRAEQNQLFNFTREFVRESCPRFGVTGNSTFNLPGRTTDHAVSYRVSFSAYDTQGNRTPGSCTVHVQGDDRAALREPPLGCAICSGEGCAEAANCAGQANICELPGAGTNQTVIARPNDRGAFGTIPRACSCPNIPHGFLSWESEPLFPGACPGCGYVCDQGWAHCSEGNIKTTGCETNITQPTSCGACGVSCAADKQCLATDCNTTGDWCSTGLTAGYVCATPSTTLQCCGDRCAPRDGDATNQCTRDSNCCDGTDRCFLAGGTSGVCNDCINAIGHSCSGASEGCGENGCCNGTIAGPPKWSQAYASLLTNANPAMTNYNPPMGFAWAVAKNGAVAHHGGGGLARSSADGTAKSFTASTRMNLASISKSVTAVALLKLLASKNYDLDKLDTLNFWSLLCNQPSGSTWDRCPSSWGSGVKQVSVQRLLTMNSCLPPDGTLWYPSSNSPKAYTDNSKWKFLKDYLKTSAADCVATCATCMSNNFNNCNCNQPQTYYYSNTNFTILEAIIESQSGMSYTSYVNQHVLTPMGIDTSIFSPVADSASKATLEYLDGKDTTKGNYNPTMTFIGAGGWVSNADELAKFAAGITSHTVLTEDQTQIMSSKGLGWYPGSDDCGSWYQHNGGLSGNCFGGDGSPSACCQGLHTGLVMFADGTGGVLLVNSDQDWPSCRTTNGSSSFDVIGTITNAFNNFR